LLETFNFHLSDGSENGLLKIRNRICAVITIASKCGQPLSFEEIALMLPAISEPINVKEFIQMDHSILQQITIQNGFIVLKGYEPLFHIRKHNLLVSLDKLQTAKEFAILMQKNKSYLKILAVCGSVAYETATERDDTDLFIVAQKDRMWIAFAKALLLARIMNTKASIYGKPINFCLSYVQDEKNFEEIANSKSLLFAREFLTVRLLAGKKYYYGFLDKEEWIKDSLPALAQVKQQRRSEKVLATEDVSPSTVLNIANMVTYVFLGNFLRVKAFLRNLYYKKKGKFTEIFEAKITKGSCLYNSNRYQELERIYSLM
jgi:hypothetical protein